MESRGESHAGFLHRGDKQNISKQEQDMRTGKKKSLARVWEKERVIADDESGCFLLGWETKRKFGKAEKSERFLPPMSQAVVFEETRGKQMVYSADNAKYCMFHRVIWKLDLQTSHLLLFWETWKKILDLILVAHGLWYPARFSAWSGKKHPLKWTKWELKHVEGSLIYSH